MADPILTTIIGASFLFGLVFGVMLLAYENGVPMGRWKKIKCKFGKHTFKVGYKKRSVYYCASCKSPRKHPALKAIDGGKQDLDIKFRF